MTFHTRTDCRLCSGPLRTILELEPTPPANALMPAAYRYNPEAELSPAAVHERLYPLTLAQCTSCGHVQLPVVVDPNLLFSTYHYVSGTSPVFREHLSDLSRQLSRRLFPADLVVEIGSNDGTLLDRFEPPLRILGVDPARNLAEQATKQGILTHPGFLTPSLAHAIVRSTGRARIILALNVLAHADDLAGIADACRSLLTDDGELVFEVAYLPDMLRDGTFDLVYHEHLAFHHLTPLVTFYANHGLSLYDAERIPTQGGSIRCFVSKGRRNRTDRLQALLTAENDLVSGWAIARFLTRVATARHDLTDLLQSLKRRGKTIAAFGCPAKATTLLHHFNIGRETLDYIVEENPLKVGKFSPGKHIPIVSVQHFRDNPPEYCLVLAWNFESNIRSRHDWFGGEWILPMPEVRVVER